MNQEIATDPSAIRAAWIEARVAEFAEHPEMRDRAIATILCDMGVVAENIATVGVAVQKEGIGGLMKALGPGLLGGLFNRNGS